MGRNFTCSKCPDNVRKLRRCGIDGGPDRDKWDFTSQDSSAFPMYVYKGGGVYGFCPAKALWDNESLSAYKLLVISAETGQLPTSGGIIEQPAWYVDVLSWFLPVYDKIKFTTKVKMVLGDGKGGKVGSQSSGLHSKSNTRQQRRS